MPHPAIEFHLSIFRKRAAIERVIKKVIEAINAETLRVPSGCEICGGELEDRYAFHHLNGYDELHQYDITWLCQSCYEDASA